VLVELSMVEQRYQAAREVIDSGDPSPRSPLVMESIAGLCIVGSRNTPTAASKLWPRVPTDPTRVHQMDQSLKPGWWCCDAATLAGVHARCAPNCARSSTRRLAGRDLSRAGAPPTHHPGPGQAIQVQLRPMGALQGHRVVADGRGESDLSHRRHPTTLRDRIDDHSRFCVSAQLAAAPPPSQSVTRCSSLFDDTACPRNFDGQRSRLYGKH